LHRQFGDYGGKGGCGGGCGTRSGSGCTCGRFDYIGATEEVGELKNLTIARRKVT